MARRRQQRELHLVERNRSQEPREASTLKTNGTHSPPKSGHEAHGLEPRKNAQLIAQRQLCVEDVVVAIETGDLLDVLEHSNPGRYPNQRNLVVRLKGYVHLVPFNIRLSSGDLQAIRARALQEGIPYQTLISSVLHKFVSGTLQERNARR